MTDTADRLTESEAAKQAMTRFLRPALDVIEDEYLLKLADIAAKPMTEANRASMNNLAMARRILNELRGQLESLVLDGVVADEDVRRAARIAKMSPEARRWALF